MNSTADLIDAYGDRLESCPTQFRLLGRRTFVAGRIRTVECREDNLLVQRQLEQKVEGDVLVVEGGGLMTTALLGDRLADLGRRNGWSGVVVNGAVRDTVALAGLDFAVKALGANPRKSTKLGTGRSDVPVILGGVVFAPGGWIYSDADGIVVARDRILPPGSRRPG